ncbi:type II CRISPR RNA-guided endonuclease Cas9 [Methylophilus sp. 5]|uniref:type II CRISPR RNA-guided endonuclease Cas9 n=1 Tax=Methylophilus sp. 5 TaxID=1112274 RepID=UPI00048B0BFB|nr:type II CRISPR RNA-guided endonuclease Cas9 [Methylophilus sp. 5]
MNSKQGVKYSIGLDIGIASVGWALLGEHRVIDLGVRCFDKAETADKGESLNLARRSARLLRRRLRRRAWRLTKLARLFKREGLIADVNVLKQPPAKGFATPNLWQLRVEALDRKLSAEEWARVIYHLCKHRGFHWQSKAEEKKADDDKEGGAVKKGLAGTKKLMQDKGYRSAAEMVINEFPDAQRNKRGDYSKALSRELLSSELHMLFESQRTFGNPNTSSEFENKLLESKHGLLWAQKPSLSGEALLNMLGKCTLEKNEYRAPKGSFTVERHVWLTRLNNCRLIIDGEKRALTPAERALAINLPYDQSSDFSYKQLRNALVKAGLTSEFRFAGLVYPSQSEQEKSKNPEDEKLIKLPAWQQLRKAMKEANLESDWQKIAVDALDGKAQLYDGIARILSVYKEDDEVERELNKLDLPNKPDMVAVLQTFRFEQFSNLSLKALYNILPHMEKGQRYDEACLAAGYHHSQQHVISTGEYRYLPPFYSGRDKDGRLKFNEELDIPRNPVVLRALNQARKVVNAIIKKYGSPDQVHIEMARDLSKSFDDRRDIKKAQDEYRDRNEKDRSTFNLEFNTTGELKGREFEKWQLYREQHGKCAYSLQALDMNRLFEMGYAEVDHALPYSRSYDDSKSNRVLVLAAENRNKGNMTPYEYLGGAQNNVRWIEYVAFVNSNKTYRQAKRNRLLRKDFGEEAAKEFSERNLNDTRYICRFFKNYVELYLKLADESDAKRCVVVNGQLTSFLRARWGLVKVRSDSDRHHALDAAIVAACSHSMVKRLANYSRRKELEAAREGFVDLTTGEIANHAMYAQLEQHFPFPWSHFRQELQARLFADDLQAMRNELENMGYDADALDHAKTLFVSRAPQRRNGGAAHKETIYGQSEKLATTGSVTQKIVVTDLKLSDLDKLVEPHRNQKLYAEIAEWLKGKDEREKRVKEIETSLGRGKDKREMTAEEKAEVERLRALPRKPTNDGSPGPVVRTVTAVIDKLSGIPIRGGVAKNDSMLRVDVFSKAGKFYLVPVYVHHRVTGLPNRAILQAKDEAEWTLIDESFAFKFTLYPNDYVCLIQKGKSPLYGYYAGCDRTTGNIDLWSHDRNRLIGKDGLLRSLGVKTAISLEKYNVDVLGNIYPAPKETRSDLA